MTLCLTHFDALTFDCYGTLIDWESGLLAVLRPWVDRVGAAITDDELLAAYGVAESAAEKLTPTAPYPDILRAVHICLAERFSVHPSLADANALAHSVGEWPAFSDTRAALKRLKTKYKLAIVSNVDRASFARSNEKLDVVFDAVITAEEVGSYKPAHGHFHNVFTALGQQGVARDRICHVAQSLYHDHVPAKVLGLATVWIDRRGSSASGASGGATPNAAPVTPDLTLPNLAALADAAGV